MKSILNIAVVICITLQLITGCDNTPAPGSSRVKSIQSPHYRSLLQIYNEYNYHWSNLELGTPPLRLQRFPNDIHLIRTTSEKKNFFFQSLLPLALLGNQEIHRDRDQLLQIFDQVDNGNGLSLHQHEALIDIQRYYKHDGDIINDPASREKLLRRVDTIPPSLILAQAANESAWGMSRFAQHANNIFGEWTFTPGTGLVPKGRPEGETYEVKRFNSLYDSVRSYLRNLNTHNAYRSLRLTRERIKKNGLEPTGYTLAGGLKFYSTRRQAYVDEIRAMIVSNRLDQLNGVTLLPQAVISGGEPERIKSGLLSTRERLYRQSELPDGRNQG